MSHLWKMKLVMSACLGLFLAGVAFGQTPTGTIGSIAGYTSTNFTYGGGTVANGGLVYVSATFTKPAGMELVGLLAKPILPSGWSVDDGLYDATLPSNAGSTAPTVTSSPEWDEPSSRFLYGLGLLGVTVLEASIKLNFAMYVPPGDTGEKELSITWYYTTNSETEVALPSDGGIPQPIPDLNVPTADLEIGGIALVEGQFSLSWNASSGVWHTVWWTDDLLTGWPSGQVFTTSSGDWADPASASVTQRFYRVTQPPHGVIRSLVTESLREGS
jgi:hypothetical protein